LTYELNRHSGEKIIMKKNLQASLHLAMFGEGVRRLLARANHDSVAVIKIHADQAAARVSPQLYG